MLNLSVLLEDSARNHPGRDAVVAAGDRLTYAEVDAAANQVANLLVARGIAPGDKVALSCPNVAWFPIIYYGILKAGAAVVPLNILLKDREIAYHLDDSDAKAYFCHDGNPELPIGEYGRDGFEQTPGCRHLFRIDTPAPQHEGTADGLAAQLRTQPAEFATQVREATDTAVILYTSGTTGTPKGAELTHVNMLLNAFTANRQFDSHPTRPDRHLLVLPLFHSFGQTVNMNAGFSVASTLVLAPRFDAAAALALIRTEQITVFAGVPTMYWSLLNALDDTDVDVDAIAGHMRLALSGGAALPVEILTRFRQRFGIDIMEGYGLSETSPMALFGSLEHGPRPGSIGTPVWGVQARLVDEDWNTLTGSHVVGEIAIRGHNVMKSYYKRPDATAEVMREGWFRTGDLARRDPDGCYHIVDRSKDLIVRGGLNVYPREIEEVLMTHHAVSLAAVVGIPHDSHGEEIKAYIIPAPGTEPIEGDLIAWAKDQMAAYKYPRHIEFVQTLPMTATGKILKRELRDHS
ncbi:long-chain-fatty-acid--CoA ligase [Nocardia africana]|uniref:Long-chain-fatty-acid--CoA ligase n=1 Tax=Nocardia africana TaxID=134964 RepID=A0A378WZJ3_9NOCA|nr:long-chain fatty acid--CoA ligase [Nocardia africana]MCC3312917.1 long-chain fatty acid--CoA ligase [Nocardia africana]SUA45743.1 Long-chain-fatty-acid--CoA ligase [Nocardia africana]